MTAKPLLRVSVRGVGAGGGVIHAPGVPGAPPLREIRIDEVTCGDHPIGGSGASTRMGNAPARGHAVAGRRRGSGATGRNASVAGCRLWAAASSIDGGAWR